MEYELVIITGASSGLGREYARALAGRTRTMVIAARRRERLESLAGELAETQRGLNIVCEACDLADPAARDAWADKLQRMPRGRTLLVNNAGLGDYGEYAGAKRERVREMVQVNIAAVAELTHALLPRLIGQGGDVLNVASLAADVPLPDFALYAASKAFVASFSEGLRAELRQSGVRVLAVCPGPVHTEFGEVALRRGQARREAPLRSWFYTTAERVVQESLRALEKGCARSYPSAKVRLAGCVLRALPLWLLRPALNRRPRRMASQPPEAS